MTFTAARTAAYEVLLGHLRRQSALDALTTAETNAVPTPRQQAIRTHRVRPKAPGPDDAPTALRDDDLTHGVARPYRQRKDRCDWWTDEKNRDGSEIPEGEEARERNGEQGQRSPHQSQDLEEF